MIIGIIGLPNSSKTTVFNAVTRGEADTQAFSSGRFEARRASVEVPDPRVDRLAEMFQPKKVTRARVTYQDIAGLAKGISEGGLSGEMLGTVAQSDALMIVLREFEDPAVPHPEDSVDPVRDLAIIDSELLLSDLLILERRIERLDDERRRPKPGPERAAEDAERALLVRIRERLEAETPVRDIDLTEEEQKKIRGFQLLTAKPQIVVLNTGDRLVQEPDAILTSPHRDTVVLTLRGRLEMELAQLDDEDRAVFMDEYGVSIPGLQRVIRESYRLLGLMSYFTVGEDEVRAWTIPQGATAVEAAGVIHSDLARGFIRADVVAYDALIEAGSLAEARRRGEQRVEGRDYVVQDGDILHVRFNV